jgi:hypothetical protein
VSADRGEGVIHGGGDIKNRKKFAFTYTFPWEEGEKGLFAGIQ